MDYNWFPIKKAIQMSIPRFMLPVLVMMETAIQQSLQLALLPKDE